MNVKINSDSNIPLVIRRSARAKLIAFVGGLIILALALLCPYISQIRHYHRYLPLVIWLPLIGWITIIAWAGWFDDNSLKGKSLWWYSLILATYTASITGWASLRVIRFDIDSFAIWIILGYPFALIVYLGMSRVVNATMNRLRRFPKSNDCQTCGYSLIGNETGKCPECGSAIKETHE